MTTTDERTEPAALTMAEYLALAGITATVERVRWPLVCDVCGGDRVRGNIRWSDNRNPRVKLPKVAEMPDVQRGHCPRCNGTATGPEPKPRVGDTAPARDLWQEAAHEFRVTFARQDTARTLVTSYWRGVGHTTYPTAADVFDSLRTDAQGVEDAREFEEWAREYGYDTDSRKAEAIYQACRTGRDKLRHFLRGGVPAEAHLFAALMSRVEAM